MITNKSLKEAVSNEIQRRNKEIIIEVANKLSSIIQNDDLDNVEQDAEEIISIVKNHIKKYSINN